MSFLAELLTGDGESRLISVQAPAPTTFLVVNPRENEIRELIARGESPSSEMLAAQEWWSLHRIVGDTAVYTRGFRP